LFKNASLTRRKNDERSRQLGGVNPADSFSDSDIDIDVDKFSSRQRRETLEMSSTWEQLSRELP